MTAVDWGRLTIAIVGGDEREQEIARLAAATGANVRAYGFPKPPDGIEDVAATTSAIEAMLGADYALLPIPRGVSGALYALDTREPIRVEPALFAPLANGAHVFCGRVTDEIAEAARGFPITLHPYDPDRELMLERAPAVVEGALASTIEHTDVTIHGATVAVVGFGNIGSLFARRLRALGADVHVVARNPVQRAAARADGMGAVPLEALADLAPRLAMIFSTVPARVVDRRVLERLPPRTLVLDIVPPPDRADLDAAEELGHRAIWARGLGRRAPITVGRSQWTGVRRWIEAIETGTGTGPGPGPGPVA